MAVKKKLHPFSNTQNKEQSKISSNKNEVVVVDLQLWKEFQAGNESAFATIYEKHVALLYSYGLKLVYDKELVKDAIQDLFIELWDTKNKLAEVQSIKAYLYKSLRRKLIAQVTKERKKFDRNYDVETSNKKTTSFEINLIEKQRFEEQRQELNNALAHLSEKQREIIHLKFYGHLSYSEIAEIMSLNKKSVYNLIARTIKLLKKRIVQLI